MRLHRHRSAITRDRPMSDSFAPNEIAAKPIDMDARRGDAVCKRRTPMRFSLIVAVLPALFVCNVARAQVGTATPTPTIGETSPLGIATGSANSPTGIPVGRHRTGITRSQSGAQRRNRYNYDSKHKQRHSM